MGRQGKRLCPVSPACCVGPRPSERMASILMRRQRQRLGNCGRRGCLVGVPRGRTRLHVAPGRQLSRRGGSLSVKCENNPHIRVGQAVWPLIGASGAPSSPNLTRRRLIARLGLNLASKLLRHAPTHARDLSQQCELFQSFDFCRSRAGNEPT